MTGRLCALQNAVGRVEACPGARCPFWEPGGAVLAGGCVIERLALDLERSPDLSHYLLELRLALDEGRGNPPGTLQLLHRLGREPSPVPDRNPPGERVHHAPRLGHHPCGNPADAVSVGSDAGAPTFADDEPHTAEATGGYR